MISQHIITVCVSKLIEIVLTGLLFLVSGDVFSGMRLCMQTDALGHIVVPLLYVRDLIRIY